MNKNLNCCDTFFDIVLTPGGSYTYPLMFNTAPYLKIVDIVCYKLNTRIITEVQHNLCKGDYVHVFISRTEIDGCLGNEQNPLSLEVIDIIDNFTFAVNPVSTGGKYTGYIAKALNLTGMRLEGSIQNRISKKEINLSGLKVTGFMGTYDVLVCGYCDFVVGDIISIDNYVQDAKVLSIYRHVEPITNKDCYCENVNPETEPCEYPFKNCVVLTLDKKNQTDFINVDKLSITGSTIAKINHTIPDPPAGIVWIGLNPSQTQYIGHGLVGDVDCNNSVYFVGKFGLVLVRGYAHRVPKHYCRQPKLGYSYDTDVINVAMGDVYVRPTFSVYDSFIS